jgi:hypothetical protein
MTTETTSTTQRNGNTEAHQSADVSNPNQLPMELELSNPWTITNDELREIAAKPDCTSVTRAYIAGVMDGRAHARVAVVAPLNPNPLDQARATVESAGNLLYEAAKMARAASRSSADVGDRDRVLGYAARAELIELARYYLQSVLDRVERAQKAGSVH